MMSGRTAIVILLLLIVPLTGQGHAEVYSVYNIDEFRSALTRAASNDENDTIRVASRHYTVISPLIYYNENNIGSLKIVAQNPADLPVFDGAAASARIMVLSNNDQHNQSDSGADIMVENLVFRHSSHGGLTITTDAANIQLINCIFRYNNDNYHPDGAGAYLWSRTGSIVVEKSTFHSNRTNTGLGGGLYARTESGTAQVTKNHFSGNWALYGGGVDLETQSGALELTDNTFQANTANSMEENRPSTGGAVACFATPQGTCRITGNLIIGNRATRYGGGGSGGGIYIDGAMKVTLENNYIVDNSAIRGGGIYGYLSPSNRTWELTNNTLWRNHAAGLYGGGANIASDSDDTTITIINNIIRDNSSGGAAGDDLRIDTDMNGNNTASTVNLNYNLLGPHSDFASGHSDDLYITNTDNYHHHDNGTDDPRLRDDGHLPSGSPAINRGICGTWYYNWRTHKIEYRRIAPLTDRDGDPRPGDGATDGCDIGADEYHFPWPMFLPAIVRPHLNPFSIPVHPGF